MMARFAGLPMTALALLTVSLAMPPYTENHVRDQDLADIYAYLLSTKPSPAAKDIPLLQQF